ncbi:hypothetical protein [Jeongeupia chitinilytica]|uniref:Uncharacterized protein n=1 Tax=Jeongeupia chitinilytica TaxID=1041641 RepID=A0ABQ3H430_9NEIS|nr:hypothetical protein [Jeongeupia chitinilytica]GHD66022.1 hypothetical protein GCM10007350_27560 [Jeongeupia chitinilytica]
MELEMTWRRAIRVWWAYAWRVLVLTLLAGAVFGITAGVIVAILAGNAGASADIPRLALAAFGTLLGAVLSLVSMKCVLGCNFGEFRVALISNTPWLPR